MGFGKTICLVVFVIVSVSAFAIIGCVIAEDWPMFRGNPSHSGYSPSSAPHKNYVLWSYKTEDMVRSSPAVADGMVFVGSLNYRIYAFGAIPPPIVMPLDVKIDVGSIHFRGEIAEFYVLTSLNGSPTDSTITKAMLYHSDGTATTNLTDSATRVATGLYRIPYTIPANAPEGTYTLVVEASYITKKIEAKGTSFKSFHLSPTLTGWNAWLIQIHEGVATIQTDIRTIQANLTAINANITAINGNIATIETDIGTIKTDVSVISATLTSIEGRVATVESDLGIIKEYIDNISGRLASIEGNIATIETDIATIKTDVNSIDANIVTIDGTLVTINSTIGSIQQDINTINGRITTISGTLVTIQTDIGLIQTDISAINARLTALDGTLATIQTDIGTITTNITDIQLEITTINGTIAAIQTTLGTLEGEITSIEGNIATIETDIGVVKADIGTVKEAQKAFATPLYVILIPVLIIAAGAILLAILMRRKSS